MSRNQLVVIGVVEDESTDLMLRKLQEDLGSESAELVHIMNFMRDAPSSGQPACADAIMKEYDIDVTQVAYTLSNGLHHWICVSSRTCDEELTIDTFRTAEAGQLFATYRSKRGDQIVYVDSLGLEYTLDDDGQ